MKSLFPADAFKNKKAEAPWKKSETDKMLDLYLSGMHPKRIAYELQRNPKAIRRRIEQFLYNERERVYRYEPVRRNNRSGMRLTENEKLIIAEHKERKIPPALTAKVLTRKEDEINPDWERKVEVKSAGSWASALDLFLACRYARLKWQEKLVNDDTYAAMEQEEIEYGGSQSTLAHHQKVETMPERISYLALYLSKRNKDIARDKELAKLFPKGIN